MTTNNQDTNRDDSIIRESIIARLHEDPKLDEKGIEVEVLDAVVILKGKADTTEEIERAIQIAASADGVKKVENHLHTGIGLAHALSVIAAELSAATGESKQS